MSDQNDDIDAMTLEALQAEFIDLGNEVSRIDVRRRRIDRRMEFLRQQAVAKVRLRALSDAEKDALFVELKARAVEVAEAPVDALDAEAKP